MKLNAIAIALAIVFMTHGCAANDEPWFFSDGYFVFNLFILPMPNDVARELLPFGYDLNQVPAGIVPCGTHPFVLNWGDTLNATFSPDPSIPLSPAPPSSDEVQIEVPYIAQPGVPGNTELLFVNWLRQPLCTIMQNSANFHCVPSEHTISENGRKLVAVRHEDNEVAVDAKWRDIGTDIPAALRQFAQHFLDQPVFGSGPTGCGVPNPRCVNRVIDLNVDAFEPIVLREAKVTINVENLYCRNGCGYHPEELTFKKVVGLRIPVYFKLYRTEGCIGK